MTGTSQHDDRAGSEIGCAPDAGRSPVAVALGRLAVGVVVGCVLVLLVPVGAGAASVYPNFKTLAPRDLRFATANVAAEGPVVSHRVLRFSNTVWNAGPGRLVVRGVIAGGSGAAVQRIYDDGGGFVDRTVGSFTYHPVHAHYHFDDWGGYQLWTRAAYDEWVAGGRSEAQAQQVGTKTTSCVLDEEFVASLAQTPWPAVYPSSGCNPMGSQNLIEEGLSVGWGDTYDHYRFEQWIDLGAGGSLADGDYVLRSVTDPLNKIYESPEKADVSREGAADNEAITRFAVSGGVLVDSDAPSGTISINHVSAMTAQPDVVVQAIGRDDVRGVDEVRLSNDGVSWRTYAYTGVDSRAMEIQWSLADAAFGGSAANGTRTVYAQFHDRSGKWSTTITDTIRFGAGDGTTTPTTIAEPSALTATAASTSQIDLAWTDNAANETDQVVERSTDSGFEGTTVFNRPANTTTFADTTVLADTRYHYRVKAINDVTSSPYSNSASAQTPTAAPLRPSAAAANAKASPISSGPGLETIMQDDGLLLHRPAAEVQAAVARMKQLGADGVRITASWSSLTRAPESGVKPAGFDGADPAAYEQARWAGLDTAIRAIRGAGLRALVEIGCWAPHWATSDPPGPRARANIDPREYASFAQAVALRYSGAFVPRPPLGPSTALVATEDADLIARLTAALVPFALPAQAPARDAQGATLGLSGALPVVDRFVLWNEPNQQALLLPQWRTDGRTPASPAVYRAMVRAGYAAVKQAHLGATVLIGNTSSTGTTRGSGPVAPLAFLRELACVDAKLKPRTTGDCAGYTTLPGDGWAHHPYVRNERPSRVSRRTRERGNLRVADLPRLAATLGALVRMGRIAPANRGIYLTEFGYETNRAAGRRRVEETRQARWLTWAEYLADRVPAVRSFAQSLLRDRPAAPARLSRSDRRLFGRDSTGLLRAGGQDKVAATSFVAGLFAQLRPKGRVLVYVRLRLGAGPRVLVLERRVKGGAWRRLDRVRVDGRARFQRTYTHRVGARYRVSYPSPAGRRRSGLALRPVPARG